MKVWDLVLRAEVATLKAHTSLVTCIVFTNDKTTMITSGRDGKVAFWNARDNFKLINVLQMNELGINEEEINAI